MITKEGINNNSETHWKLHVPAQHCLPPGLEVGIFAVREGLMVGGNLIRWEELDTARLIAQNYYSNKCTNI